MTNLSISFFPPSILSSQQRKYENIILSSTTFFLSCTLTARPFACLSHSYVESHACATHFGYKIFMVHSGKQCENVCKQIAFLFTFQKFVSSSVDRYCTRRVYTTTWFMAKRIFKTRFRPNSYPKIIAVTAEKVFSFVLILLFIFAMLHTLIYTHNMNRSSVVSAEG